MSEFDFKLATRLLRRVRRNFLQRTRRSRDRRFLLYQRREWYQKNRSKLTEKALQRYYKNWEYNRKTNRAYIAKRLKTDAVFKTVWTLRSRIRQAIKKGFKSGSSLELLGCTIPEFKAYFSSLFTSDMTWENHGQVWHIDHKRPCASFDLSSPEQQRLCFHYSNLQPLFVVDNLKKGKRW